MKTYLIETRRHDGSLDLKADQPPFLFATENQMADYYFSHGGPTKLSEFGNGEVAAMDIFEWFKAKNWHAREKTW